ncbi:MAG: acetate--CoA ligase family protein [Thermoguttaceae bacterium]|nr:acetate--CoA ligase family protein [Thermoguttaceae bacterium]
MSIVNLDKIFAPKSVTIIGASERPGSIGSTLMKNLEKFAGKVYPINPKSPTIHGVTAYKTVGELPEVPDLAVICTPAKTVSALVEQLGEKGNRAVIIITAGFREVGSEGKALEQQVIETAKKYDNFRIVGPNCLGVLVPETNMNASFAATGGIVGRCAFISQSGALGTAVLDWANYNGVGFSYFVSMGNAVDVSMGDLLEYFGQQDTTDSAMLYIESIPDAKNFMESVKKFSAVKPIVAYKSGRFAESAAAAASHTGAMAGMDAVYDAALKRAGVQRVLEISEVFDCTNLMSHCAAPKGERLAIVTNAGGPGVMTTDALIDRGGKLAKISDATMEKLNAILPSFWSHGNPIDVLGDAKAEAYAKALEVVLDDPQIDGIVVILTPQAMSDPTGAAKAVVGVAKGAKKPILTSWMGGTTVAEGVNIFRKEGIPTYETPERAVDAFIQMVRYEKLRQFQATMGPAKTIATGADRAAMQKMFKEHIDEGVTILPEDKSKELLAAYGIPVTMPVVAKTADEAVALAAKCGFPVVMKIHSHQITHKTDVGGVKLNITDEAGVRGAFEEIITSAKAAKPEATIIGCTVQPMVKFPVAYELIVGQIKDATFGPVVMVGMGGTLAEVFKDRALMLPPLNAAMVKEELEHLKYWKVLKGYRGKPGANIDKLVDVIIRFGQLVSDYPEIKELDINPVLATPDGVMALDARVVLDEKLVGTGTVAGSALAVTPDE